MFLNYWPVVAQSWKELFNVAPTLVLVAPQDFDSLVISKLREFGEVEVLQMLIDVPVANQAKLARWFYACQQKSTVALIEDIDTIFLKSDYLKDRLSEFDSKKLLGIGSEVDQIEKRIMKFPASNMTGKGELFAKLFGYRSGMVFEDFVLQFKNSRQFDGLEDPYNSPKYFSDESLIRALRASNKFTDIKVIERNIDIRTKWLDRSWWPSNKDLDVSLYTTVNFLRPLRENFESCRKVIEVFFPNEYPWMLDCKTPIYKNRDHGIRRFPSELGFAIRSRFNKLNSHKVGLMSKFWN